MKTFVLFILSPVIGVVFFWAFTFLLTPPEMATLPPLEEESSPSEISITKDELVNRSVTDGFVISGLDSGSEVQVAWGSGERVMLLVGLIREQGIVANFESSGGGIVGINVPTEQIDKAVSFLNDPSLKIRFPKIAIGRLDH